jgi:hypothetical protein
MSRLRRSRALHSLLTCAAVLLAACGGGSGDASSGGAVDPARGPGRTGQVADPGAAEAGLHVRVERSRLYETTRTLKLTVGNPGRDAVEIRAPQLRSPLFEVVAASDRRSLVRPGREALSMPLAYGAARCDADPDDEPAALSLVLDGEPSVLDLPDHPPGALGALHGAECAAAAVAEAVTLRFGEGWAPDPDGRSATGHLELELRADSLPSRAAVRRLDGTVVFSVDVGDGAGSGLPEVRRDRPRATVPVTVTAARCDPHALIESKRTHSFVAWVALDDGDPVRWVLEATGEARRATDALLAACLG